MPVHYSRMINSENAPKETGLISAVAYRFGEHGKMADGWKPATICYIDSQGKPSVSIASLLKICSPY